MSGATPEERETKLAVADGFVLPRFDALAGVTVDDEGERVLVAVYWDSDRLDLAHAGVGLRRRNGVWTFKGTSRREGDALVREELEVEGGEDIPARLRERVAEHADPASLHPVATVRTIRHTWRLRRTGVAAELVRDRVTVLEAGDRAVASFTEVEVEFDGQGAGLADDVVALLVSGGAVVDTVPKYVRALRALGHAPPEVEGGSDL